MTTDLPLRHLSIRIPWHDAGWKGKVCTNPVNNASCLRLGNIHEKRDDAVEVRLHGRRIDELEEPQQPPCVAERATFMAPFTITRRIQHPYFETSSVHRHYRPTSVELPPYTAGVVPFRWVLRKEAGEIAESHGIVFHEEAEEDVRAVIRFPTAWVQDVDNQTRMLDGFFSAIEPDRSLAFFYAKEVPHTERSGRVLIGVGHVNRFGPAIEYDYDPTGGRPTRSMIWERVVHHSIRPGTAAGGFLLPYHAALERAAEDPSYNPEDIVVFAPGEAFDQFSYGSEHLTHDHAIASLLAMIEGLRRAEESLGRDFADPLVRKIGSPSLGS